MGDSAITIVAIFLAAILMFVFPLMTMADKKDDVSTLSVQNATTELVDKIATTGKITQEEYDNFILTIGTTGNSYDVEITVNVLDENPAKKENNVSVTIGDNIYYVKYTTQVLEEMTAGNGVLNLKEGDMVSVNVKNTNVTIAEQLRNFMYKITGNSTNDGIAAAASCLVSRSGQ